MEAKIGDIISIFSKVFAAIRADKTTTLRWSTCNGDFYKNFEEY